MTDLIAITTIIGLVLVAVVAMLPWFLAKRGVTMTRTRFGTTLIFDSEDADGTPVRLLNVNGTFQSVTYIPPELRFELACVYHRDMAALIETLAAKLGRPAKVLVMGGGGYSLPQYLAAHGGDHVRTTAVEIDPAITTLARKHFFLDECLIETGAEKDGRLTLVNGDAWGFLTGSDGRFDVIVNDAFSGKRPLGPMATDKGALIVAEHLEPGGMYLANVRCALEGRRSQPLRDVEAAFSDAFAHTAVLPEWPDEPEKPGNNVFVATDDKGLAGDAATLKG